MTQASSYTPATLQALSQTRPTAPSTSYQAQPSSGVPPSLAQYAPRPSTASSYRDPPPIEVYTLPDHANLSIPPEIREQYQRDEFGHVLFFTAPPVCTSNGASDSLGGHSVRYLAEKARRAEQLAQKRKEQELQLQKDKRVAKKARLDTDRQTDVEIEALKRRALGVLEAQLAQSVDSELTDQELGQLSAAQNAALEQSRAIEANGIKRAEMRKIKLGGDTFRDDWHGRVIRAE